MRKMKRGRKNANHPGRCSPPIPDKSKCCRAQSAVRVGQKISPVFWKDNRSKSNGRFLRRPFFCPQATSVAKRVVWTTLDARPDSITDALHHLICCPPGPPTSLALLLLSRRYLSLGGWMDTLYGMYVLYIDMDTSTAQQAREGKHTATAGPRSVPYTRPTRHTSY